VAAWPDSQSFRLRRSNLNLSAGRKDRALDDLREIRRSGQATVEVLAAEASILASEAKTSQALDVMRDGLHLYPERGRDIYLEMSRIMRQGNQTEGIPPLMDEGLARYPDEPLLWLVKIKALAALSRADDALATAVQADLHFAALPPPAEAAHPADPTDAPGLDLPGEDSRPVGLPEDSFAVELADYYAQENQVEKALAILQPLAARGELGLNPSLWLGRLLLGTGREAEGVQLVERILAQWPDAGRAWFLRGKVEEGQGKWPRPSRITVGRWNWPPTIRR